MDTIIGQNPDAGAAADVIMDGDQRNFMQVVVEASKQVPVLVDFWATWCAPCVKEMPSLDKLQAELGKERFLVLPLSLDTASRAKGKPFYERNKFTAKLARTWAHFKKSESDPAW